MGVRVPPGTVTFLVFFFLSVPTAWVWLGSRQESKFGRVVKALALGASLERGMGSNPIACIFLVRQGGVAHSVERSVRNRQAQGSKPCSSTCFARSHVQLMSRQWCIGNIEASQALAPGSTPGWRIVLPVAAATRGQIGGVAQMVERLLCMQEAQGSIPCSSKYIFARLGSTNHMPGR